MTHWSNLRSFRTNSTNTITCCYSIHTQSPMTIQFMHQSSWYDEKHIYRIDFTATEDILHNSAMLHSLKHDQLILLEIQPHPLLVFLILYLWTYLLYLEPYLLSFILYIYQFPFLRTSAIHYYDMCLTEVRTTFILSSLIYYLCYDYGYCILNRFWLPLLFPPSQYTTRLYQTAQ